MKLLEKYKLNWCPWHKKIIKKGNPHHLKKLCGELKLTKDEVRVKRIQYFFPTLFDCGLLNELYIEKLYSLPDFEREFGIKFHDTQYLLKWFGIPLRNASESAKKITQEKYKKFYNDTYGVDNASQLNEVKEKKKRTFIKNYGVDNIWKSKKFQDDIDFVFLRKYGMSRNEHRSLKSSEVWSNKTEIEKKEWLNKSIYSETGRKNWRLCGCYTSKIELKIQNILNELEVQYVSHYPLKKIENGNRNYYYDIYIKEYNLIIEINGTYWHADPRNYKPTDKIHYKKGIKTANEIWERDKKKIDFVTELGYNVLTLWEIDINSKKTNKQLIEFLYNEIDKIKIFKKNK